MEGIKIIRSDEKETEFLIEDSIKVTLLAENFNKNGEMIVDYDENSMTVDEVSEKVNSYFAKLINLLEDRSTLLDETVEADLKGETE